MEYKLKDLVNISSSKRIYYSEYQNETERKDFSRSISYFIGAHGGRFLTDTESYAEYLQQSGDLEKILFI